MNEKKTDKLLAPYRIVSGKDFRLKRYGTQADLPGAVTKEDGVALLRKGVERLAGLQDLLYAHGTWSLLVVIQAMDAAGKDGTIKHVMSGVNPQGVAVTSFKVPGPRERAHDFLWAAHAAVPSRGMIGIFNRSYYEEVLVTRVHPDLLAAQHLPPAIVAGERFWEDRLDDIAAFERLLVRNGTKVLKFFLHVGRDEQKKRFLDRLDQPDKTWKFNAADLSERRHWAEYMAAYEAAIAATATPETPWFVVPADQKWFMRLVVVEAINEALAGLDLKPVLPSPEEAAHFADAKAELEAERE